MSPAANDDHNLPPGFKEAHEETRNTSPVTSFDRARHARLLREHREREKARRARTNPEGPDAA